MSVVDPKITNKDKNTQQNTKAKKGKIKQKYKPRRYGGKVEIWNGKQSCVREENWNNWWRIEIVCY